MIDLHFGKTLLFTDRNDWSDEQVIAAYRSQAKIEDAFRQMKDAQFVCWRPLLHWTDQKVRVHAAYCVFALLLSALLLREVRRAGVVIGLDLLLETRRLAAVSECGRVGDAEGLWETGLGEVSP